MKKNSFYFGLTLVIATMLLFAGCDQANNADDNDNGGDTPKVYTAADFAGTWKKSKGLIDITLMLKADGSGTSEIPGDVEETITWEIKDITIDKKDANGSPIFDDSNTPVEETVKGIVVTYPDAETIKLKIIDTAGVLTLYEVDSSITLAKEAAPDDKNPADDGGGGDTPLVVKVSEMVGTWEGSNTTIKFGSDMTGYYKSNSKDDSFTWEFRELYGVRTVFFTFTNGGAYTNYITKKDGTLVLSADDRTTTYSHTSTEDPSGNNDPGNDPSKVTGVTLNKTTLSIAVGEEPILEATILPSTAKNQEMTWTSSDKTVATIYSDRNKCVVTAKKAGKTTITVTTSDGQKTAKCVVTVKATTEKPAAPTNLGGYSGTGGPSLYWDEPLGDVTAYYVYRATTKTGKGTQLGKADYTTYIDKTAVSGKTYWYYVEAYNTHGFSDPSERKEIKAK